MGEVGETFARLQLMDQHGETFDLYDMSLQGKLVLFELGAMWCVPCQSLGSWLSHGDDPAAFGLKYPNVLPAIDAGELYYVSLLTENAQYEQPDLQDLEDWDAAFGSEVVPVLADVDGKVYDAYYTNHFPAIYLLDETMNIVALPVGDDQEELFRALGVANELLK